MRAPPPTHRPKPAALLTAAFAATLLAPALAAAQPTPPQPPSRTAPQNPPRAATKPDTKPGPKPGPKPPVVTPKPGAPAHHPPGRPAPSKPAPRHPPAAAPAPVPEAPVAPEPEKEPEPTKGSNTGNPLPRFATLRSDEVNLRTGPGTRYPIDWVYKRRDLPVIIEREFEVWRLVRDPDGVKGWVHQATLAPRRTGVVIGGEQALRSDPKDTASEVARLKPGVIVRLRSCEATSDWCQGQVQDYRGWIKRSQIWGTFPGEAIQ